MIPMSSKADAVTALSVYPACRLRGRVGQRVAWVGLSLFGPGLIPGTGSGWHPPCGDEVWEIMASEWRRTTGAFTSFGVHLRRPLGRDGFSVLLIETGRPKAFVKVRRSPSEALGRELAALETLHHRQGPGFLAPDPLDHGRVHDWDYLVLSPLPPKIHTVVRRPDYVRSVVQEIQGLGDVWDGFGRQSPDWVPIHGDLTPWNLRRVGERLFLYDWESRGWGPSGADLLWYDAAIASRGLRVPKSGVDHGLDSYAFWLEELEKANSPTDAPDPQVLEYLRWEAVRLRAGASSK
jgi:hypothetical protein